MVYILKGEFQKLNDNISSVLFIWQFYNIKHCKMLLRFSVLKNSKKYIVRTININHASDLGEWTKKIINC